MDVITQFGFGGGAGFVLGYALKKVLKAFFVLLGLYLASLVYLDSKGYIDLDYSRMVEAFQNLDFSALSFNIPLAGFALGFAVGFKAG